MQFPEELRQLVSAQAGVVARTQLREAGFSDAAIRWRLGRGWRLVLPGVVATFTGPPSERQRLVAAQLYAGEDAVITSWTAAAWHGVESARRPSIRLAVPFNRSSRSA